MQPIHYSLLLHFVGVGLIFTTIIGGWLLNGQYRRAADWNTKVLILKALRPIGLLSPLAVVVMLLSGVGNMTLGVRTFTLFSDSWLSYKLVFFLILVVSGIFFGVRSARRSKLIGQLAAGSAPGNVHEVLRALDRQQVIAFLFQVVLLLLILALSIVKPQA